MRLRSILFFVGIICFYLQTEAQLKSPDDFLPHKWGEQFTPHRYLPSYFNHVAENSPLVKVIEYGRTNEGRPLILAFISSEENIKNLEQIRKNNLALTGLEPGGGELSNAKALVWLSYSVHGNESAGTESSYQVLFHLADPTNKKTKEWLKNTVVIMDPCVNPDGYSRYVHWVRQYGGKDINEDFTDIEHHEPWPGGRMNHFFFDLNRDWAWQTQIESQQRLTFFNQWLPHVHADLHEMGRNSPYYFAPAAKPYHRYITKWQRDFQVDIGKNHAKYFDSRGWRYFTKEVFDLFYPSYGDTYPIFNGAIGMTYEQGGSGRGGRAVKLDNGEVLTLKDRVEHHHTTSLSTVEISSIHAKELIENFRKYYKESASNPPGKYHSYILKRDKGGDRLNALCQLLDKQGVRYSYSAGNSSGRAFSYRTRKEENYKLSEGDVIVQAKQPKAILAQVLLDPENELEDSLTYDITAWALPYAYGIDAYASTKAIGAGSPTKKSIDAPLVYKKSHAYALRWRSLEDARSLTKMYNSGLTMRSASKPFSTVGQSFERGTVVVHFDDNKAMGNKFHEKIKRLIDEEKVPLVQLSTGFSDAGPDLGSGKMRLMKKPKVLLLMGDGVSAYSFGTNRHFFESELNHGVTIIKKDQLNSVKLEKFTTLVLPDGRYRLTEREHKKVREWVSGGGKVIAISGATRSFLDKDGFALKSFEKDADKASAKKENEAARLAARFNHYSERERKNISKYIPGAIVKMKVDGTHPLGYGLGTEYFSLKTNSLIYPNMAGATNVIYTKDGTDIIGFVGSKLKKKLNNTVSFAVETKGRGNVVYMMDDPLFRAFWKNGLFLYANAVFMVN